ncbi:MAG: cyclic nucleotide-binding domain-containing protein [Chthoniobacteraceae bacterium]|jgi:CRP-like cAMP-binding protein
MPTEFLRDVSIFKDLTEGELDAMKSLWTLRTVAPRERIVEEGALMHEFYIVSTGVVHVRRLSQDHEVLLARIGRGGFFGEINLFNEATATASVYAMDEVSLAVISNNTFRNFMASRPDIGYKITARLLNEVSMRLRQTNERLVHSMFWSTTHLG